VGLRGADDRFPLHLDHGPLDRQPAPQEVHVTYPQGRQFTEAQPGVAEGEDRRTVAPRLVGQGVHLLVGEEPFVRDRRSRHFYPGRGVAGEPAVSDC